MFEGGNGGERQGQRIWWSLSVKSIATGRLVTGAPAKEQASLTNKRDKAGKGLGKLKHVPMESLGPGKAAEIKLGFFAEKTVYAVES